MRAGEAVSAMCVDVIGLRAFSRHYSYARAERVLGWIGDMLLGLAAPRTSTVVGRLGADEFLAVTTPEAVTQLAGDLLTAFDVTVGTFYDPADAERGWIDVTDRAGRTRRHRPITLAVGVAGNDPSRDGHHLELVERAAEMARYAGKGTSTSRVAVDRRS